MPSEHKLHPLSFLFSVGSHLRTILLPGLLVLLTSRSGTLQGWSIATWQVFAMVTFLPYAVSSLVRYITFRYQYAPDELVIRTGLIFRNERHIPYARIHNIDSLQNPFHRLFRVAEVRIETAGGAEPEARIQVLPKGAVEEMRRRVFEVKRGAAGTAATARRSGAAGSDQPAALREVAVRRHDPIVAVEPGDRSRVSAGRPAHVILDSQPGSAAEVAAMRLVTPGTAPATDSGTAQAAASGTASATDSGIAQAADSGTASATDSGITQAADSGTASATDSGIAQAADSGTAPATDSGARVATRSATGFAPSRRTLLHLPVREILLHGIVDNRGFVVIAATLGLLWETGLLGRLETRLLGEAELTQRSLLRGAWRTFLGLSSLKSRELALTLGGIVILLVVIRFFSMCWAVLNLYGFTLTRAGDELSVHCGLITRRLATIPQQRIQTLSVRESPLHRLFGRSAVRVETAGGNVSDEAAIQRQRLAPLVAKGSLPDLVKEILPELDLRDLEWRRAHPRAFRRALKSSLIVAGLIALGCVTIAQWWTPVLFAALVPIAWLNARFYVAHLGYALTSEVVVFRSGWLWRKLTAARYGKMQAVTLGESPFDRRSRMASVRIDTAGAGGTSHRIDIPYLDRAEASRIFEHLTARAAETVFRW